MDFARRNALSQNRLVFPLIAFSLMLAFNAMDAAAQDGRAASTPSAGISAEDKEVLATWQRLEKTFPFLALAKTSASTLAVESKKLAFEILGISLAKQPKSGPLAGLWLRVATGFSKAGDVSQFSIWPEGYAGTSVAERRKRLMAFRRVVMGALGKPTSTDYPDKEARPWFVVHVWKDVHGIWAIYGENNLENTTRALSPFSLNIQVPGMRAGIKSDASSGDMQVDEKALAAGWRRLRKVFPFLALARTPANEVVDAGAKLGLVPRMVRLTRECKEGRLKGLTLDVNVSLSSEGKVSELDIWPLPTGWLTPVEEGCKRLAAFRRLVLEILGKPSSTVQPEKTKFFPRFVHTWRGARGTRAVLEEHRLDASEATVDVLILRIFVPNAASRL